LIFGVSGDFRENRCRLRESRVTVTAAGGAAYEIGLVLPRSTDGGGPLKLVLRGSRKACIDIPFTLRDVPLR
jgi:hypothetical protein